MVEVRRTTGSYGYSLDENGELLVKKSNKLEPYNYVEAHTLSKPTRILLNRYLAQQHRKKGNEAELGSLLIDAFEWFINEVLHVDPESIPRYEKKTINFDLPKHAVMRIRDVLNKDRMVDFILQSYFEKTGILDKREEQE